VNSRVRIALEWRDAGKDVRAEGYTVDTSSKGCMVVLLQPVPVGERVRLLNLINHSGCDATVAWNGTQSRGGWEVGLELQESSTEFWGLEF
jgi:hypothetical protein